MADSIYEPQRAGGLLCDTCHAPLLKGGPISPGELICERIYNYAMAHPTLNHVSHAMLPQASNEERAANKTPATVSVGTPIVGVTKVELPPGNRNCTSCGKVNLGWCPYCNKSYCSNQNCIESHALICPGLKEAMKPHAKAERTAPIALPPAPELRIEGPSAGAREAQPRRNGSQSRPRRGKDQRRGRPDSQNRDRKA